MMVQSSDKEEAEGREAEAAEGMYNEEKEDDKEDVGHQVPHVFNMCLNGSASGNWRDFSITKQI